MLAAAHAAAETFTVRFEHSFMPEIGMHRITSPDLKGFHITGKTYEDAEREAFAMLALIHTKALGGLQRSKVAMVQFDAA